MTPSSVTNVDSMSLRVMTQLLVVGRGPARCRSSPSPRSAAAPIDSATEKSGRDRTSLRRRDPTDRIGQRGRCSSVNATERQTERRPTSSCDGARTIPRQVWFLLAASTAFGVHNLDRRRPHPAGRCRYPLRLSRRDWPQTTAPNPTMSMPRSRPKQARRVRRMRGGGSSRRVQVQRSMFGSVRVGVCFEKLRHAALTARSRRRRQRPEVGTSARLIQSDRNLALV